MGWVLKPSAHNSINVLSSKFMRNSISIESSYVRADQPIMDSYQLQYTQHGLVTVTLHITRYTNNRVMWKTNHHYGHSILVLRPNAINSYDCSAISLENQKYGFLPAERQQGWSCFTDHKGHTLLQDYHAWNSWRTLEEGKLVSILYFLIFFFFVSENHMLTLTVVHFIFCICDSSKNLHLLMTYLI